MQNISIRPQRRTRLRLVMPTNQPYHSLPLPPLITRRHIYTRPGPLFLDQTSPMPRRRLRLIHRSPPLSLIPFLFQLTQVQSSSTALLLSFLAHGPRRAVWQRGFPVCFVAVLCVQSSSLPMRVAPTGALPSPSLWLVMLRDTQTEKPTGTFLSPDYAVLPPHLVDVPWRTWHGEFMSARAVSK